MYNILQQNSLNEIILKLQLIYSNSENLKVATDQLWNELVCNFTVIAETKVGE